VVHHRYQTVTKFETSRTLKLKLSTCNCCWRSTFTWTKRLFVAYELDGQGFTSFEILHFNPKTLKFFNYNLWFYMFCTQKSFMCFALYKRQTLSLIY
jgi:hypothetical protein